MSFTLRHVLGALRITHRRANELGQPGLGMWATMGEGALRAVGTAVAERTHQTECAELAAAREITEIIADGAVTPAEIIRLRRTAAILNRCAHRAHDIGEAVRL